MTVSNDVFRFTTLRGVQRASSGSLKSRLVRCDDPVSEGGGIGKEAGHSSVRKKSDPAPSTSSASLNQLEAAARVFLASAEMVKSLDDFWTPLAHLDSWLLDRSDRAAPEDVKSAILPRLASHHIDQLPRLLDKTEYIADRRRASTSLTAATLVPEGTERARVLLIRAMRLFGLIEELAAAGTRLRTADDVFAFLAFSAVILPKAFPSPTSALSRPPAIADLKVVRQKLLRYETGEIAHIENVLIGENKSRVHRRKDLREEILTTESERETSEERELQTAERFEMQRETSGVIKDDIRFQAGATLSASYGPTVSATASAGLEMDHSQEESKRVSQTFAREVMERSASKVRERVRSQRTVRIVNETEETNTHGLDNKEGDRHVVGIYRYVNKVYEAQVFNYGKRLMLEFMVPEPASFIRQLLDRPLAVDMEPPQEPMLQGGRGIPARALLPSDITRDNYLDWAARYFAQEIAPPPANVVWLPLAWDAPATPDVIPAGTPGRKIYKVNQTLDITEGYEAVRVRGIIGVSDWKENIVISIGDATATLTSAQAAGPAAYQFDLTLTHSPRGKLPVGMVIENCWGYEITMHVKCKLTLQGYQKWQLETYNQIIRAYFELKSLYAQKVSAASVQRGVAIEGRNPFENRKTERNELKKHVVSLLERSHFDRPPLDQDALRRSASLEAGYNEIVFPVAERERSHIQWFEQAFEWQNMTYVFYPYFWGGKPNWKADALGQDLDPLFNDFLRAGAARVVVPVRPGFERAMGLYLAAGVIWNGTDAPQVGDPLFISAVQEIQEQLSAPDDGTPEGDPWPFTLPTPLVILQPDGTL